MIREQSGSRAHRRQSERSETVVLTNSTARKRKSICPQEADQFVQLLADSMWLGLTTELLSLWLHRLLSDRL